MRRIIQGVGLLLIEPNGKLLVLKELQNKPHIRKEAGMLSFPLETIKEGELFEDTLLRLVTEEIGIPIELKEVQKIGTFDFKHDTCEARVYMFIAHVNKAFVAKPTDTDIDFHGWMDPNELLNIKHKRVEVQPILNSYLCC